MFNDQSLVEQARALLEETPSDITSFAKIDLAVALLQLEQARQLKRIADALNNIERIMRR